MAYLNYVALIGNLTRDPEMRYTQNGTPICSFGIAMSKKYQQNGQEHEEVCFVDVAYIRKGADGIARYLAKGSPVLVTGSLKLEQWTGRDGGNRSRISVQAERVQFLNPPPKQERQSVPAQSVPPPA